MLPALVVAWLVAATAVVALAEPTPDRDTAVAADAASLHRTHDATELKASGRSRQPLLSSRTEGSTAKVHPVLLIATLLAGLLMAAAVASSTRSVPSARASVKSRRHALSLRGPPLLQLA